MPATATAEQRLEFARWLHQHGKIAEWGGGEDPSTFEPLGLKATAVPEPRKRLSEREIAEWGGELELKVAALREVCGLVIPKGLGFEIRRFDYEHGRVVHALIAILGGSGSPFDVDWNLTGGVGCSADEALSDAGNMVLNNVLPLKNALARALRAASR